MPDSDYFFTENEIELLKKYRDSQKNPKLKLRFVALLALAVGNSIEKVSQMLGFCSATIVNWYKKYSDEGIECMNSYNYIFKKPYLDNFQVNQVVIFVIFNSPATVAEVTEYIKGKFGVKYCDEAVRQMLIRRGLGFLRPRTVPGSPSSVEDQEEFILKYQELRQTPGVKVLFSDAMHLHHQNIPGFCWGDPGLPPVFETNSGRKRLNILGAYDPEEMSVVHHTGEENCNADKVIDFLEIIKFTYKICSEIHIVVDNARYFYAAKVRDWLEDNPKIHFLFLPPYAPNLNLIERYWRLAKKHLVRGKYYKKYKTFRAEVFRFLNNTKAHLNELKSLMVEKFEIIKHN